MYLKPTSSPPELQISILNHEIDLLKTVEVVAAPVKDKVQKMV